MSATVHLWAVGFDDMNRADQVREKIAELGWGAGRAGKYLILVDALVVVRNPDGSFTFKHEPFSAAANIVGCGVVGLLAGLVLGVPITGATIGAALAGAATAFKGSEGIDANFVREVEAMLKPGTSALFVLDEVGDLEIVLDAIRGLGGKVLKTNVDAERVKPIESALAGTEA